jgi:nitroreductase
VGTPVAIAAWAEVDPTPIAAAAQGLDWRGMANRLSADHVEWPVIDRVGEATRYPGSRSREQGAGSREQEAGSRDRGSGIRDRGSGPAPEAVSASRIILQRRSAVAFDGRSTLPRDRFARMLSRLHTGRPPWDALDWPPHVHLAIFVHRVEGLVPGLYAYLRDASVQTEWQALMRPQFLWEPVGHDASEAATRAGSGGPDRLFLLLPTNLQWAAMRVCCDQDIAGAGFFSLGMIARLGSALHLRGEWFYRRLYWECGVIGQVLYVEAEAAGARATGIGCFYDDPVHELLGLSGTEWQSLYHFSAGMPVEDSRLTVEPGYGWESTSSSPW